MNFFNKYKDLFEISDGVSFPKTKLNINNEMFIQKPYVPTYTQSYNLNSKLKDLKRDYDDLENQITELSKIQKRMPSRKKQQIKKNYMVDEKQKDIIKYSQMDYIFQKKMKQSKPINIPQSVINRRSMEPSKNYQPQSQSPYLRKFRHERLPDNDILSYQDNSGKALNAKARRQQAKNRINQRRTKLNNLLKNT